MMGLKQTLKGVFSMGALAVLSLLVLAVPAMAESRIGVVDLRQALFSSEDAKAFSEQLQRDFAGTEEEVRKAQQEARSLQERLQKDGAMMNESERERLKEEFQAKAQEFTQKKEQLDQTLNTRKQTFLEDARPEVDAAVKELMEEYDLDIILPSETVVYVKPELNLTEALLEKLNQ